MKNKLKSLLKIIVVLTIILCFCVIWYKQYKEVEYFKENYAYPFKFSKDTDSMNYITDDFQLLTEWEYKGKKHEVSWKSDSDTIKIDKSGKATVGTPICGSETVTLTEVYGNRFNNASIDFKVRVVSNQFNISTDDVLVITLEDIENNIYPDVAAFLDDNGNVTGITGNLGNTTVSSINDAMVVLDAYRGVFNIPPDAEIKYINMMNGTDTVTYVFELYVGDIRLGNDITVTIDSETGRLTDIIGSEFNLDILDVNAKWPDKEYVKQLIKDYVDKNELTYIDVISIEEDYRFLSTTDICHVYKVDKYYTFYVYGDNIQYWGDGGL